MSAANVNAIGTQLQTEMFAAMAVKKTSFSISRKDFASMMNDKMNSLDASNGKNANNVVVNENTSEALNRNTDVSNSVSNVNEVRLTDNQTAKADTGKDAKETSMVDSEVNSEITDLDENEQITVTVIEIAAVIIQQITSVLNIDTEQLANQMQQSGIEFADLMQNDGMAKLVASLNSSNDITSLLNDSELFGKFEDLKQAITEVFEKAGITPGEFENLIENPQNTELQSICNTTDCKELFNNILNRFKEINQKNNNPETENSNQSENLPDKVEVNVKTVKFTFDDKESFNKTDSNVSEGSKGVLSKTEEKPLQTVGDTTESVFVKGLEKAVQNTELSEIAEEQGITARDIVYQVVNDIKVSLSPEGNTIEVSLTPESLGKVNVSVTSKDGVVTARFSTDNQVSKEAIESQLQILKETIEERGFKVDAIEVAVSGFSFTDSKNADSNAENYEETTNSGLKIKSSAVNDNLYSQQNEDLVNEVILQSGSTVTYVA